MVAQAIGRLDACASLLELYDWVRIQETIDAGGGYCKCQRLFGIAHATWRKAVADGLLNVSAVADLKRLATRRYDWNAIQIYHDAGYSVRACRQEFGFSMQSWEKAR
jgi:hypothetical protein